MRYKYLCKCGATAWVNGSFEDPTTGTVDDDITEGRAVEWEGGNESCDHEDSQCVDSEYDDDMFWHPDIGGFV